MDTMQGAAASRNLMLCFEEIAVQNIILKAGKKGHFDTTLHRGDF